MAASTFTFLFTWENDVSFQLQCRKDEGDWSTVISADENTHIPLLTAQLATLSRAAFNHELTTIMGEMNV